MPILPTRDGFDIRYPDRQDRIKRNKTRDRNFFTLKFSGKIIMAAQLAGQILWMGLRLLFYLFVIPGILC
jgi:hypothetical protein